MKLTYALPLALATLGMSSASVAQRPADPDRGETERIAFASGTDGATLQGFVPAGDLDRFVLRAGAGQTLIVSLDFTGDRASVGVFAPDGSELGAQPQRDVETTIAATGDYVVTVGQSTTDISYTLSIRIPVAHVPGTAARVEFAPGTDHAVLQGSLTDGVSDRYVLRADAGRTMTFDPVAPLHLRVTAPDGTQLPGGPGQTISYALPQNGDYVVEVLPGMGEQDTYAMTVTIPAQPGSPVPAGQLPATR